MKVEQIQLLAILVMSIVLVIQTVQINSLEEKVKAAEKAIKDNCDIIAKVQNFSKVILEQVDQIREKLS